MYGIATGELISLGFSEFLKLMPAMAFDRFALCVLRIKRFAFGILEVDDKPKVDRFVFGMLEVDSLALGVFGVDSLRLASLGLGRFSLSRLALGRLGGLDV